MTRPIYQRNISRNDEFRRHRSKFRIGAVLEFKQYDDDVTDRLHPGEELMTLPENGCGMGIDVIRLRDGHKTMVWPTEVKLGHM